MCVSPLITLPGNVHEVHATYVISILTCSEEMNEGCKNGIERNINHGMKLTFMTVFHFQRAV